MQYAIDKENTPYQLSLDKQYTEGLTYSICYDYVRTIILKELGGSANHLLIYQWFAQKTFCKSRHMDRWETTLNILAEEFCISKSTVSRVMKDLVSWGLLDIIKVGHNGANGTVYKVNSILLDKQSLSCVAKQSEPPRKIIPLTQKRPVTTNNRTYSTIHDIDNTNIEECSSQAPFLSEEVF